MLSFSRFAVVVDSLSAAESLHSLLLKLGVLPSTFFSNKLISLYASFDSVHRAFSVFNEIHDKNIFSYNTILSVLAKSADLSSACRMFDEMPHRDIVSYNTMISCYMSFGLVNEAVKVLNLMQKLRYRPNEFTLSIASSIVKTVNQAKEVHAKAVRSELMNSNVVLQNSFIDMYGKIGLCNYASLVFEEMEEPDVISWNSLIQAFGNSLDANVVFWCFSSMRNIGFAPDKFTISTLINICTRLQDLAKGEQILTHCFKMGLILNSIVSSALIDMYSNCDRLDRSVQLFRELQIWDAAICNSMTAAYSFHGLVHMAQSLFVLAFAKNIRPTEFTFANILSLSACFGLIEQGTQFHCMALKMGFVDEVVVASALLDIYAKIGSIESSKEIFYTTMHTKDTVSWNAMIIGLARNGKGMEALRIFYEMQRKARHPDRITLLGVLLACSHEGMVDQGKRLFASMAKKFGVKGDLQHYACMVDMLGKAGMLRAALEFIISVQETSNALILEILLEYCIVHKDLKFAEVVAERMIELKPWFSLPYETLAQMYETRGKWESMARILSMKEQHVKEVRECSWIGIRGRIFDFNSCEIMHWGGESVFLMLRCLSFEMEEERCRTEQHETFEVG